MLLFIVLSLAVALGRASKYNCEEEPPECWNRNPIPPETAKRHHASGNIFPSNEFFQESCPLAVEDAKCGLEYLEECPDQDFPDVDVDLLLETVEEFCNETSDIRKAYVDNVDCFNRVNFMQNSCFLSFISNMERLMQKEMRAKVIESEITNYCLGYLGLKPCAVQMAEDTCGEDASLGVSAMFDRLLNIIKCRERDAKIVEELFEMINSAVENGV